jgi:hypothetical protein
MVNQMHAYCQLMPVSQGLKDLASHIKMSQITYFSYVFSGKRILTHGKPKT